MHFCEQCSFEWEERSPQRTTRAQESPTVAFEAILHRRQIIYMENASKNRQGGLNQLKLENKSAPVFASLAAGIRCHVQVLDLYLSKLPPVATEKDFLYW